MTEQELLNQIKESASHIEIPDSLTPERIAARLNPPPKTRHISHFPARKAVSAAAVLLLCGILSSVAWNNGNISPDTAEFAMETATGSGSDTNDAAPPDSSKGQPDFTDGQAKTENAKTSATEPKKDAGTLYTVAESYDQVYDIIEADYNMQAKYRTDPSMENGTAAAGIEEGAAADADVAFDTAISYGTAITENSAVKAPENKSEYSSTNLQTKGVDESDNIKTDGRYIYTVTGAKLKITDTADGELKLTGFIAPDLSASDSILEFYIDESRLFLLVQHYDTSLTEETSYMSDEDSGFIPLTDCAKMSSLGTNASSILYTYDITDPASPSLVGTTEQDGYYYTSRKIGDIIYLFTQQGLQTGDERGFIPCINEEKIPYDHIYVPDSGSEGFIISSVNITNPDTITDSVMLVHNSVNVYVAADAIYLYNEDYRADDHLTQIAKFSIEDGIINAVNATSVKGAIYDTFAINASQNMLRILTTYSDRKGNTDNRLYILDSNLELMGSLDGIARGEDIYAARYFGNTAYFITYKDIDPLFAVDLTDPSHPVLLGELEITGFSDYLHFWGTDKLLGIGYETDPKTGNRKGLKLVMFDISNPTDLKIIDSTVLKDAYYSPALYDYKCVLADPEKNLIGFAAEHYTSDDENFADYHIFSFTNDHFNGELAERLPDYNYISYDSVRGIYIADTFYIACPTEITSYDMTNQFEKSGYIDLTE